MRDGGGRKTRGKACELVGQVVDTGATGLIREYPNQAKRPPDYSHVNSQVVVGDGGGTEGRGKACELVGQVVDTGATGLIREYPNQVCEATT